MKDTQLASVRFGAFELDLKSGELFSAPAEGPRITTTLARQPFQLLVMLLEREGAMVTREEIQNKFWPNDTIVEFNHSINVAIGKLRRALGDSASDPQYVVTVASRGYRFLAPVEWIAAEDDLAQPNSDGPTERLSTEVAVQSGVQSGQTVSHYRVLDIIGGGGMGVVYRAEDLKLGRRVAIKFLPSETAADAPTLQRFEREAQTASSLNHPNICTVYEFGEHEGAPFLVMEWLQGETLRDRLASSDHDGLPLDEVLDIALQVSSGLQAAHERGIIHRDIKPANIFLTSKGIAKILDFGLAKMLEQPETEPSYSNGTATRTSVDATLSRIGFAMGTAGYMSPEQARGERLDARSDLFSFGLVLYEMATGKRAFSGSSAAIVRDAILHQTHRPVRGLNPRVPPAFEDLINSALEKDRERRLQSADEMRCKLQRLQRDTVPELLAAQARISSDQKQIATPVKRRKTNFIAIAAGACLIAALALGWVWHSRQHAQEPTEVALTQNSFEAPVMDAAISPNGNLLAFADASGLNLKVIASGEVHSLYAPAGARIGRIAWFPDSSSVLFTSTSTMGGERELWMGSIFGGAPRMLRSDADDASVSADGSALLFTNGAHDEIWSMDAAGGNARKLVAKDGLYFYHPAWYAGQQRVLYLAAHQVSGGYAVEHGSLESLDLKSGNSLSICSPCDEFAPMSEGRLIYGSDSSFWKISVDAQTAQPTGHPQRIPVTDIGLHPTVSADGKRLVMVKGNNDPSSGLGAVVFVADLEDRGRRLANQRRLTTGGGQYTHAWTPDSQSVVFESISNGRFNIYRQGIDRTAQETLVAGSYSATRGRFSPDGKWLLYFAGDSPGTWRIMRAPASGGPSELLLDDHGLENLFCTNAAANLCVLAQREQNQLIFYAFDPAQKLLPGGLERKNLRRAGANRLRPQ